MCFASLCISYSLSWREIYSQRCNKNCLRHRVSILYPRVRSREKKGMKSTDQTAKHTADSCERQEIPAHITKSKPSFFLYFFGRNPYDCELPYFVKERLYSRINQRNQRLYIYILVCLFLCVLRCVVAFSAVYSTLLSVIVYICFFFLAKLTKNAHVSYKFSSLGWRRCSMAVQQGQNGC